MTYPDGELMNRGPEVLASALVLVAASLDLLRNRVPNALTVPAAGMGLLLGALRGGLSGLGGSLAGLGVGIGLLFVPFVLRGIHGGDVKLMGAVGAFLGPQGAIYAFLLSSVFGGLLAVAVLIVTSRGRKKLGIFWVRLNSLMLTRDVGMLKQGEGEGTIHLPYAVPIALGTLMSIWMEGILR